MEKKSKTAETRKKAMCNNVKSEQNYKIGN